MSQSLQVVGDQLCTGSKKPIPNKFCNKQPCPFIWEVGDWSPVSEYTIHVQCSGVLYEIQPKNFKTFILLHFNLGTLNIHKLRITTCQSLFGCKICVRDEILYYPFQHCCITRVFVENLVTSRHTQYTIAGMNVFCICCRQTGRLQEYTSVVLI